MCRKSQGGCSEQLEAKQKAVLVLPLDRTGLCMKEDTYVNMEPKVVFLTYVCNLLYWIKSAINSCACSCIDIEGNISLQGERGR